MNIKEYRQIAGAIQLFHVLIVFSMIVAILSIFFYEPLRFYSAIWLTLTYLLNKFYGGCPLTIEEYKLRELSGERIKRKKFVARVFKNCFNLNISDKSLNRGLTLFFFISLFVIILHLI